MTQMTGPGIIPVTRARTHAHARTRDGHKHSLRHLRHTANVSATYPHYIKGLGAGNRRFERKTPPD
jgi:hypothetical protein